MFLGFCVRFVLAMNIVHSNLSVNQFRTARKFTRRASKRRCVLFAAVWREPGIIVRRVLFAAGWLEPGVVCYHI